MEVFKASVLCVSLVFAACGTSSPTPAEEADPGLARIDVQHGDATVVVTGYDGAGQRVGEARLSTGAFTMQDDGRAVVGRQLSVDVLGEKMFHESEGFTDLNLPLRAAPKLAAVNAFLLDSRVQSALGEHGVAFRAVTRNVFADVAGEPSKERAHYGCSYTPSGSCGATSCAEGDSFFFYSEYCGPWTSAVSQVVCCGNTGNAANRICGYGAGNPCGTEGPAGCAVCWTAPYGSYCNAYADTVEYGCTSNGEPSGSTYVDEEHLTYY